MALCPLKEVPGVGLLLSEGPGFQHFREFPAWDLVCTNMGDRMDSNLWLSSKQRRGGFCLTVAHSSLTMGVVLG